MPLALSVMGALVRNVTALLLVRPRHGAFFQLWGG